MGNHAARSEQNIADSGIVQQDRSNFFKVVYFSVPLNNQCRQIFGLEQKSEDGVCNFLTFGERQTADLALLRQVAAMLNDAKQESENTQTYRKTEKKYFKRL